MSPGNDMTEYDYSPEAYERYLATQNRIASWVQNTEQHRPQFENALSASRPQSSKRTPPPSPPHRAHHQPPRPLHIHPPSPASDSEDGYAHRPGPMPLSSPPIMMYQYPPPSQPMVSPPPMLVHPSYTAAPHHKSSHHRHRPPHAHARSHSQQTPAYYSMASPPVSPGYQYPYPAGGYFVVQPQHRAPGPMPIMSNIAEPPRSAPPNISSFSVPPTPPNPSASSSYFQHPTSGASTHSAAHLYAPRPVRPRPDAWSYGAASPSHSVVSGSTGTVPAASSSHYFPTSIPQYQGIHSAMASPTYAPQAVPPGLHQRVYDLQTDNRHYYRRSVG